MRIRLRIALICALVALGGTFLDGCTSYTTYRVWEGGKWVNKWRVENRGSIKTEVTKDKVSTDTKQAPWFDRDIPLNKVGL